jgi:glycosyltransferase involved in cell wall biosynthesis
MRLLFLVHGLPVGGTEVLVSELARRFRRDGLDVSVGCLDEVGELGSELSAEGVSVELYSRRAGFDARLAARIAGSVRRHRVDVVHAHQYTPYFYGVLAKVLTGVPLIFTEHGRLYPDLPSRRRRAFNRMFAPLVDRITAVSEDVRDSLWRVEGIAPARVSIVQNGIDLARFTPRGSEARRVARESLSLPSGAPVIGTVGRLDPIKNYPLLLSAFRRLLVRFPEAVLLIVGDGPERQRLESLARESGIEANVRFLGMRRDVDRILPGLDVFVLSSFSEGMPVTLIEAMAAGVPVVATAVGGIPRVIRDGQEGLLVSGIPPNPLESPEPVVSEYADCLAEAIGRLLDKPELGQALAARAATRACVEFSLETMCARYRRMYEEVIAMSAEVRRVVATG